MVRPPLMFRRTFLKIAAVSVIVPALRWHPRWKPPEFEQPATLLWTGAGGDGDIANPRNWHLGRAPRSGDSLVIGSGAVVEAHGSLPDVDINRLTVTDRAVVDLRGGGIRTIDTINLDGPATFHQDSPFLVAEKPDVGPRWG